MNFWNRETIEIILLLSGKRGAQWSMEFVESTRDAAAHETRMAPELHAAALPSSTWRRCPKAHRQQSSMATHNKLRRSLQLDDDDCIVRAVSGVVRVRVCPFSMLCNFLVSAHDPSDAYLWCPEWLR